MTWPIPKPAVKTAISVLQSAFPGVAVDSASPKNRPAKYVTVSRIGGGQDNPRMDSARLLIECWARTDADAEVMTGVVRATLRNAGGTHVDDVFIYGWGNESGPVMYDDPDISDRTRWQLTGDLSVSTR